MTRLLAPDLARGLALALIAVANVMIYLHGRPYGLRQHVLDEGTVDQAVGAAVVTFVDGRAYPLFAALFGYGLVRIWDRAAVADPSGVSGRAEIRRRGAFLMAIGLVHALFGFSGDVLGWYGLLAVLLAGIKLSDRALLTVSAAWLLTASAVQGFLYAESEPRVQRSYLWSFAIEDPARAAAWRLVEWPMTAIGLLAVVSALLVGMWAARHRLLENIGDRAPPFRRVAWCGITAGVLGGVMLAIVIRITASGTVVADHVLVGVSGFHVLTGVLGGLGYLAGISLVCSRLDQSRRTHPITERIVTALRATGQRSLSCYLAQSVVFVALLPAWTIGFGARLGVAQAAGMALATWLATVVVADQLARRGRPGPAEVLLRRGVEGRQGELRS